MGKLRSKTVSVERLDSTTVRAMYHLYEQYYENVTCSGFTRDLRNKQKVILLYGQAGEVRGFSTVTTFDQDYSGRQYHIIYSGDTIIDQEYRGSAALALAFLRIIIAAKLKRPVSPVYWFLVSKGFKTYLLLANNFINYYPRYDRPQSGFLRQLTAMLAERIYPGHLDHDTGIIRFGDRQHEKLKSFVSPITAAMCETYPKISFFQQRNPNWEKGDELACVGEVSLLLGIVHPLKVCRKSVRRMLASYIYPLFASSRT